MRKRNHKFDNARRLDAPEGQVRTQTNKAKEYTRIKCLELDRLLRTELHANAPNLVKGHDQKIADSLPGLVQTVEKGLNQKIADSLLGIAQAVETKVRGSLLGTMATLEAKLTGAIAENFAEDEFKERIEALPGR